MVSEVNENLAICVTLENLACSYSIEGCSISFDDIQEVSWGYIFGSVVNVASSIDILSIGLVEDLAWEWVVWRGSNIIISKYDNVILWDSILL